MDLLKFQLYLRQEELLMALLIIKVVFNHRLTSTDFSSLYLPCYYFSSFMH